MDTALVESLKVEGQEVPVQIKHNKNAKRLILRINKNGDGVVVTLPQGVSETTGLGWAKQQISWIAAQMAALPRRKIFKDGAVIPFEGVSHIIRHLPNTRRGVWRENGEINVSGQLDHLARRVQDWLKNEAKSRLVEKTLITATRINKRPRKITVRDTRSRWGSCTANGNISYCWRLILAPRFVLDYVVAHEVAHLKELDHGKKFWDTVAMLDPNVAGARRWLREKGEALHFIG